MHLANKSHFDNRNEICRVMAAGFTAKSHSVEQSTNQPQCKDTTKTIIITINIRFIF